MLCFNFQSSCSFRLALTWPQLSEVQRYMCAPQPLPCWQTFQVELLQFHLRGGAGVQGEKGKPGRSECDSMGSQSQLSKSGTRDGKTGQHLYSHNIGLEDPIEISYSAISKEWSMDGSTHTRKTHTHTFYGPSSKSEKLYISWNPIMDFSILKVL